jgi:hypothetical protein
MEPWILNLSRLPPDRRERARQVQVMLASQGDALFMNQVALIMHPRQAFVSVAMARVEISRCDGVVFITIRPSVSGMAINSPRSMFVVALN